MPTRQYEVTVSDGTRIPMTESGSGRPLLIVPGVATPPEAWQAVREALDPHMRVAVMSRRGILGDPLSSLTMEQEFQDVADVAASLGDEVDIIGHSSGALYALGAAPLTRGLRRLVLYEPPWEGSDEAEFRSRRAKLQSLLEAGDIDGMFRAWWTHYVGMPPEVADAVIASPVGAQMRPLAQYIPRELLAHLDWHFDPAEFARITAPTLFLYGENSPKDSPLALGFKRILGEAMPHFTSREIPGQDHMANFLAPELLAEMILHFVAETSRSPA